eukprot:tig00000383_g24650.t1
MSTFAVSSILEKMGSRDKDFRYMATSDLLGELQKDTFKMDADGERKICVTLLKQLEDSSGDIQGLAVKCLSPLVKKVHESQVEEIVDTLCTHLLKGKEEQRDISSIGLKTVINELPANTVAHCVAKRLVPKLLSGIRQDEATEVKLECLEILNDLLKRFGSLMAHDHDNIKDATLPLLAHAKPSVRKKALVCVASLAMSIPERLLSHVVEHLLDQVQKSKGEVMRTYIQTMGAVSRTVGYRLGKHLERIVPLFIRYCDDEKASDDELRENCLQALESFVQRCAKEVTPHVQRIVQLCLKYVRHDPNYQDAGEDDDGEAMSEDGEDEGDDDDDNEYSDDEDVSWKVRRACAKCLEAIIASRLELIDSFYGQVAPVLIQRFREREENVKLEIFAAFSTLVKQTAVAAKKSSAPVDSPNSPLGLLRARVGDVVKSIRNQLKAKSLKSRVGAFALLRDIVQVLPGALAEHIAIIVPGIEYSFADKASNATLKIETLAFVRLLLASHPPTAFRAHLKALTAPVFACVADRYYKVSAEGLRVCAELARVLRPVAAGDGRSLVETLYGCTLQRLTNQDQDLEVKEAAIACMGVVISNLGQQLTGDLKTCLPLLLERMRNEITRLTAVKALAQVAEGPDLANRPLKLASLSTLEALVRVHGSKITPQHVQAIAAELGALIGDVDLHLSHLALRLCCSLLLAHGHAAALLQQAVLPRALALIRSPLLQGHALNSLVAFLGQLVASGVAFEALLEALMALVRATGTDALGRHGFSSLAQCVAALCSRASPAQREKTVATFVASVAPAQADSMKIMALMCLGEIGRQSDLSSNAPLTESVLASFDSLSEEVKSGASFALGNIAVGNMTHYLPIILHQVTTHPKRQYLLLHSLKEVISRQSHVAQSAQVMAPYMPQILPLLFAEAESEEEGVRNVVAECLGKLALVDPPGGVKTLNDRVASANPRMRQTLVTALKHAIIEQTHPIDALLPPALPAFLRLIADPDLKVRRAALLTLNSAAHSKPRLIRDMLAGLLPALYGETVKKPELIRQVDLGPFKHVVDDGLEIRKAAFECMDTLLDSCLDRLDTHPFLARIVEGLRDHYDIKVLCHLMLQKLATAAPSAVLAALDSLVDPLKETVTASVKENAVKQELERNEDVIRSALRAVDALARIPDVETCARFDDFLQHVVKSGKLLEKFTAIRLESEAADTAHTAGDHMDIS